MHMIDPWSHDNALHGRTVLLAMSGGVDSSAAAVILQQRGARVLGVTMKNFCWSDVADAGNISCCSVRHTLDAQKVCEQSWYRALPPRLLARVQNQSHRPALWMSTSSGRTPNPCVDCNSTVRFPLLLQRADELGAELVATGHYARMAQDAAGESLSAAWPRRKQGPILFSAGGSRGLPGPNDIPAW